MLGGPSGRVLGPPRPPHLVRKILLSRLVRSKAQKSNSEAVSEAISVLGIAPFLLSTWILVSKSQQTKEFELNVLWALFVWQKPNKIFDDLEWPRLFPENPMCKEIFVQRSGRAFAPAAKPRKTMQNSLGTVRILRLFSTKLGVQRSLCTKNFAGLLSWWGNSLF